MPTSTNNSRGRLACLVPLIVFVVTEAVLYPVAISIKDESVYLTSAYILRTGSFFTTADHLPVAFPFYNGHEIAPIYPPGIGLLLLPATLISWRAVFAVPLAMQIIGYFVFRDLLGRLGLRPGWAWIYLLYPPLVLYSRTLMSEVPTATLFLVALDLYARRSGRSAVLAGVVLGLLGLLRSAATIPVAFLILAAAWHDYAARSEGVRYWSPFRYLSRSLILVLGFAAGELVTVALNLHIYGSPFGPYGADGKFGLQFLPGHLLTYVGVLMVIWPGLVLAPLVYRGPMWREVLLGTMGTLLVMAAWYFVDAQHGFAENVVTIPRLLLPVMPLWLLGYVGMLERLLGTRARALIGAATAGACLLAIAVSVAHQRHLRQAASVRELIAARVPAGGILLVNPETGVFVGPAWGRTNFAYMTGQAYRLVGCASRTISVVYSSNGEVGDRQGFGQAEAKAAGLAASEVTGRTIGPWQVVIWQHRRAHCS